MLSRIWLPLLLNVVTSGAAFASEASNALLADPEIQSSFQRLNKEDQNPSEIKKVILEAWYNKCENNDNPNCYLNECDIKLKSCNSNRIILFRGEPKKFEYAGASALLRNTIAGLGLGRSARSTQDLLKISGDIFRLTPLRVDHVYEKGKLLLIDGGTGLSWHLLPVELLEKSPAEILNSNTPVIAPKGRPDQIGAFFFAAQSSGYGSISYLDMAQGFKDISPLVSLSPSPLISLEFTTRKAEGEGPGRLIVLSVPKNKINSNCDRLGAAGTIVNYGRCVAKEEDDETAWERELNAILFIPAKYVLYSIEDIK